MTALSRCVTLFASVSLVAASAAAQTGFVLGTVTDESLDPLKGATVTAEDELTTFTATTDDDGQFVFIQLRSGMWTFTARAPGYTPSQISMATTALARNPRIRFVLARGAAGRPPSPLVDVDMGDLLGQLADASSLFEEGRYLEAIRIYRSVVAKAPALTTVYLQLGNAYLLNENFEEAAAAYNVALQTELDPLTERQVLFSLGEARERGDKAEEAKGWYWRAHEHDPAWSKPLLRLGLLAMEGADQAEARRFLTMAVAAEPESPESAAARRHLAELARP